MRAPSRKLKKIEGAKSLSLFLRTTRAGEIYPWLAFVSEEKNENFAEYSYGKNFKNLITYNAMGRANTLLHIIWDKIHEKYTSQQIGKALKLQDEILNG